MVAGIICEYNPFHAGHGWMLQQLREGGADGIVCVMSGDFVQRGEFAVADKFARAEMAVRCGADVVLELPAPWSAATAEVFASGGVSALAQTGVVTHLAFGSECGDAEKLMLLAKTLGSEDYNACLRGKLRSGKTFAVCRREAAAELLGEETAALLDSPNNNLGVEYCRALLREGYAMQPVTVVRTGAAHDGAPREGIASASHIRNLLKSDAESALGYMPAAAAEILRREIAAGRAPVSMDNCSRAVLAQLRRMSETDFARYAGGSEGLHHRFYQAVRKACDLELLLDEAKTKRYTHARLRRMLLSAYLELPAASPGDKPPYLRVLAAGERGRELLRQMRDGGAPILTKAADVSALGEAAEALLQAEARRHDLYVLGRADLRRALCGEDYRTSPVMV